MTDESGLSGDVADRLGSHRRGSAASGTIVVSESSTYVGDTIEIKGRNCPADATVDLRWHTVEGQWGVLEANEVVGPQYRPRTEEIATVETDADGAFDRSWTVPEDYGGGHRIEALVDGQVVGEAEVEITPWFDLERTEAPLGEAFTLIGYGLGPEASTNDYQITWDNGYVGFLTGVQNRGTATAEVRAVGSVGDHVLQVWRNYRSIPYLQNNTQSPIGPVAGGRQSVWTVEVTDPEQPPRTAWVDPLLEEGPIDVHYPDIDGETEATLELSPTSGQPGTDVLLRGRSFPPNREVDLTWYQHVGDGGIRGGEVHPEPREGLLPTVTTDADGAFEYEFEVPLAEGSTRPITAAVDGREVAITGFMVQPSIETFEPTSGPVGTEIEIELSGIGWTAYENAPFFVYDNDPVGYACGMTDEHKTTKVTTVLRAAGDPGYHFIDVYPSIFEMADDEPEIEVEPHLSYLDNHPVRPLPALHMTFEVTE